MIQLKEELMNKEKMHKSQLDRLNRQVNDYRQENSELRDEIAQYDAELREAREQNFINLEDSNQHSLNQNSLINNKVQYTGIGQGVLNRRGSRPGSSQRPGSGRKPGPALRTSDTNQHEIKHSQKRQSFQKRQTNSVEEFQHQE